MPVEDQLASLLARNATLFTTYENWSNGQTMLLTGTRDDPASFNAGGGSTGNLGYYPIRNVNGDTIYIPCEDRIRADMEALFGVAGAEGMGFLSSIAGAVSRPVAAVLDDVVNPLNLGGTGDGITYDSAALDKALDSGKHVYLPPNRRFRLHRDHILQPTVEGQRIYGGGQLYKSGAPSISGQQFVKIDGFNGVILEDIDFLDDRSSGTRAYAVTMTNTIGSKLIGCKTRGWVTPVFVWQYSHDCTIAHCDFDGGDFGIATGGINTLNEGDGFVERLIIAFNRIAGARSEAVDINWNTKGAAIVGNVTSGNNSQVHEEEYDIGGGICRDIILAFNQSDCALAAHFLSLKLDTRGVHAIHNIARGMTGTGLQCFDEADLRDVTYRFNQLYAATGNNGRGAELRQMRDCEVSDNLFRGFGNDGILELPTCRDNVIDRNQCLGGGDHGLVIQGLNTKVRDNKARDNQKHGMIVQGVGIKATGNDLRDNSQLATGGFYGLVVEGGSNNCSILDNDTVSDQVPPTQRAVLFSTASDKIHFREGRSYGNVSDSAERTNLLTNSVIEVNSTKPTIDRANAWSKAQTAPAFRVNAVGQSIDGNFEAHADAGRLSQLVLGIGTAARWALRKSSAAEAGANSGADFVITAFGDGGASLGDALVISRATRAASFAGAVTAPVVRASGGPGDANFEAYAEVGRRSQLVVGTAGSTRWALGKSNAAEAGGNAGSDFVVSAFGDGGTSLGDALVISRATRAASFGSTVNAAAGLLVGGAAVVDADRGLRRRIFTVATLPTQPVPAGTEFAVSDSLTTGSWGAPLGGGGTSFAPVISAGNSWVYG